MMIGQDRQAVTTVFRLAERLVIVKQSGEGRINERQGVARQAASAHRAGFSA